MERIPNGSIVYKFVAQSNKLLTLLIVGSVFYSARIPERWFSGLDYGVSKYCVLMFILL
jgi:hypothetical protein